MSAYKTGEGRPVGAVPSLLLWALLPGCEGPLSSLAPAGRDAQTIAQLFWWMAAGGALVWLLVMGLTVYAIRSPKHDRNRTRLFVIGGGAVLPTVALSVLLICGLALVPGLLAAGEKGTPKVRISGEQWWWRVQYEMPNGERFELANELRLPVDRRISLELASADVIHSFWVPSLAGKMDLIPGRTNQLALEPTRTGVFMGVCAEYCGVSHANMLLHVIVLEQKGFDAWADKQLTDATAGAGVSRGQELFLSHGCGACHTIRGTAADGIIGPDLTHVGGRQALGAGILANDVNGFRRWLVALDELKPHVRMPAFDMLPEADLKDLATYLDNLE